MATSRDGHLLSLLLIAGEHREEEAVVDILFMGSLEAGGWLLCAAEREGPLA